MRLTVQTRPQRYLSFPRLLMAMNYSSSSSVIVKKTSSAGDEFVSPAFGKDNVVYVIRYILSSGHLLLSRESYKLVPSASCLFRLFLIIDKSLSIIRKSRKIQEALGTSLGKLTTKIHYLIWQYTVCTLSIWYSHACCVCL